MRPPDGASSHYAALRHEVARAAAILPRNQLRVPGDHAVPQQAGCDGRYRGKQVANAHPTSTRTCART